MCRAARCPYDWQVHPNDSDRLIETPEAREVIERIKAERRSGRGLRQIARTLDEAGVSFRGKPLVAFGSPAGAAQSRSAFRDILTTAQTPFAERARAMADRLKPANPWKVLRKSSAILALTTGFLRNFRVCSPPLVSVQLPLQTRRNMRNF